MSGKLTGAPLVHVEAMISLMGVLAPVHAANIKASPWQHMKWQPWGHHQLSLSVPGVPVGSSSFQGDMHAL